MNFFGTDGIRGTYGSTIFDRTAFLLGKSLAINVEKALVVIARDTRLSGQSLTNSLASGVYSEGGNVIDVGILPTNAVSHLVRHYGADFGVMVSASHNPPQDNGLKVFDKYGIKLCNAMQQLLSNIMASVKPRNFVPCDVDGVDGSAKQLYVNHLLHSVDVDFAGLPICVDCDFGAGFDVAKEVFGGKNANVICVNDTPNGESINVNCGATHPHVLAQHCQKNGIKLGFCLDGDADRLVVVEEGKVVDGSRLIFAVAKYLNEQGRLTKNAVVGTVVTNGGLELALKQIGCNLLRSQVGDTKVFQLMKQAGASLGGEDSGHVIFGDQQTGSDALLTALVVGKICVEKGSILHYSSDYVPLPTAKSSIRGASEVNLEAVSQRIEKLFPSCRIVLRKSGTEAVVRAYVEGQECNQALVEIEKSLKS